MWPTSPRCVRVRQVCGTDVHLRHGRLNLVPSPIIPGHVSVGTVCRVAGVVRDAEGQPVRPSLLLSASLYFPFLACVPSVSLSSPKQHNNRVPVFAIAVCGHQLERGTVVTFLDVIGTCNSLPTAMHAIERAGVRIMDTVVVLGSGPVGLLAALLARHSGAGQVIVVGAPEHRLAVVRKFGIEATIDIQEISSADERLKVLLSLTGGRLADVVIEATGQPVAVQQGMDMCRNGGTFVVVGQYTDNGDISINPHLQINRKHLTVKGCWGSDFSHFCRGVRFMEKTARALPWELCLSREFSLGEAAQALDAVESLQVFKALIKP
eukprot:jgi/Mesen1/3725/ME000202S02816